MPMTVEELLEAMRALIEAAGEEPMSEEDMERYEQLEAQLAVAQRAQQIRARQTAYETPRADLHVHTGVQRDSREEERAAAFDRYLRTGDQSIAAEFRAQSEGTGSEGGFLVPTEFRQKIVERMVAFGGFAELAETITTSSGGPLEWPTLDDTANVGGITPEGAAFVDGNDLVFGTASVGAYKYTSTGAGTTTPLRVSVELLQDSAFDVQALVSRALGTRIARAQATDWINGSGAAEPQGIAGSSITENADTDVHDVVDYDDLIDLETMLDPAYEQGARWVMSKATWNQVRSIIDGAQRPLIFDQAASGIGRAPEKMLLGYPVTIDQAMPAFPGAGNEKFIALGDWREAYLIRRVANLTVMVNPYSRANNGQVEYTAWERADGVVQNRNAYVLMANTAS